jgi:hypothetical protein
MSSKIMLGFSPCGFVFNYLQYSAAPKARIQIGAFAARLKVVP